MPVLKEIPAGTFTWVDLGTTDIAGAKKFYGDLFDWQFNDMPVNDSGAYTMLQQDGKDVGGLYGLSDEMKKMGVPPNWLSYVSVDNADDAAKKATELGGQVMTEPFDVMDVGRMAIMSDPTGAVFAIWQQRATKGEMLVNEPNALCWNELVTNNVDKAGSFYTGLLNWGSETKSMGEFDYTMFLNGEKPAGGMMPIQKEWGEVPPNWMIYFAVAKTDATVEKTKDLGGKVLSEPNDIPEIGRFATLQDPQGAVFAVMEFANPPQE